MEKFGIFELLDTLSALILPDGAPPAPPETAPQKSDAAFAPPVYGDAGTERENSSAAAISSFLEKHDRTVKKLDGGNRQP